MRRISIGDEWEHIEYDVPVLPNGINGDVKNQHIADLVYVGPVFPTVDSIAKAVAETVRQKLELRQLVLPDLNGGSIFGVPTVTRNPWKDYPE